MPAAARCASSAKYVVWRRAYLLSTSLSHKRSRPYARSVSKTPYRVLPASLRMVTIDLSTSPVSRSSVSCWSAPSSPHTPCAASRSNTVQLRDRAVQYDGAAEWLGQARVGSSSVGFGVGRVADQGFPSGCCRCGGRRSWADGATAAGVAGAGGDLFFDWDGAAFRGLL